MGLDAQIRAKTQRPSYRVRINGSVELVDVESVQIENDFDRSSATATITCAAKRNVQPNDEIIVEQGYSGYMRRTFTGYVDDVDREAFPNKFVIAARDILKRAIDNYIVDEIEYDSVQAEDAVKDLLERSGIYNYSLDTTSFTIGDVNPAKFSLISAMDAIKAIADLIGWRIWATKGGLVRFMKVYPRPSTEYRWLYTKDPTFGSESGMVRVTRSFTDVNLRNWIEVWGWTNPTTGDTIKATAYADSPFVPSPPRYRKAVVSSEIIDTQGMADWIAARVLSDLNCLLERGEVEIQGNPRLNVGDTIRITEDWTDQSSGVNYFIYGLSSRMDAGGNYTMSLQIRGGKNAPPYTDGIDPVACFVVEQVGWGDPYYVVYVDASCSYDPDGDIASYDIDWGDASGHATTVRANHHYAGAVGTEYTITLVVTDNDGLTGTASKVITIGQTDGGSTVYDRVLYVAVENGSGHGEALGSPDSGNTWYTSGDLGTRVLQVTVSSAEDEGYAWFGGENGKLWKTIDYCQNMTLVYTFASAVRSLWLNRAYTNCMVAGLDNGKVYITLNSGVAWKEIGDFEGPVRWVINYSSDINHIIAAGGVTTSWLRETIDGGISWRLVNFTGLESIYDGCIHFADKFGVVGHTHTSPVRHSVDGGYTWTSPVDITDQDLNSITGGPYDELEKLAGGDGGQEIWRTTDGAAYVNIGNLTNGTKVTKVLMEQHFWATVFAGCDDDVELSFDSGATWKQLKDVTATATDIAQGPLIKDIGIRGIWSYGDGKVHFSSNGGRIWVTFATGGLADFGSFFRIVGHPTELETAYMTSYDSGNTIIRVWKTTDGNVGWNEVGTIDGAFNYAKILAIDPIDPDILWVGASSGSGTCYAYKSVNGGVDWTQKWSGITDPGILAIACSTTTPNRVLIDQSAYPKNYIHLSVNGGDNWSIVSTLNYVGQENLRRGGMGFSPNGQRVVFRGGCDHPISGGGARVAVSTDAGDTWAWSAGKIPREENWNQDQPLKACVGVNSHTMFVLSRPDKFYRSDDVGTTWVEKKSGSGLFAIADPMVIEVLWAIHVSGFERSIDNGETWILLSNPGGGGFGFLDLSCSGYLQQTWY